MIATRRIQSHDAHALAQLRHTALRDEPDAFAMSPSQLAPVDDSSWAALCSRNSHGTSSLVVATAAEMLVGMAGIHVDASDKMRHCGMIWGVYVAPAYRGQGIATMMLTALIAHGVLQSLRMLKLSVTIGQHAAIRLYERLGFVTYAYEPALLLINTIEIDALHMVYRYPVEE